MSRSYSSIRRTNRRAHHERQLREVRYLLARRHELHKADGEWVKLAEPMRWGWERYWYVRPDLVHTAEWPTLRRLLVLVQRIDVSHRRDFAERDWRRGNKLTPTEHRLRMIDAETYWALTDKLRAQFQLVVWRDDKGKPHHLFSVIHPWKFVSRTRPHFVTHLWVCDGEVMGELERINGELYGPQMKIRALYHEYGGWSDKWDRHYWRDDAAPTVEGEMKLADQEFVEGMKELIELEKEMMGWDDDEDIGGYYRDGWFVNEDDWYDDYNDYGDY